MVDDAGRYFVHLEIGHPIGSDNHRTVLFVKSINDLLQRIRTAIYIVAIELDGKLATSRMMHTHVPATADPQIGTFRNQMNHTSVCGIFFDRFGSSVCRMVIHNNQIKAEGRFCASTERIASSIVRIRLRTGMITEASCSKPPASEGDRFKVRGKITADPFQVGRTNSFHLDLHRPVFGST